MARTSFSIEAGPVIDQIIKKTERQMKFAVANRMLAVARAATNAAISQTPVWTGTTMLNYVWSIGSPDYFSATAYADDDWKDPVFPISRSEVVPEVMEQLRFIRKQIFSDPYRTLYLNNNTMYSKRDNPGLLDFVDLDEGRVTNKRYGIRTAIAKSVRFGGIS